VSVLVRLPGLSPYAVVADLQARLVDLRGAGEVPDVLLLLSHPETITLGRRAGPDAVVAADGVDVVEISRGGEATWHGPGQLVGYPIVRLQGDRKDVHGALHAIEQGVIDVLADLGLSAGRDPRNTGVWLDGRKVCSIGIGLRRWVVRHGLALNVDADLAGFARIRPCGFEAGIMTRLADHLPTCPPVDELAWPVGEAVAAAMGVPATSRWEHPCQDEADAEAIIAHLTAVAGVAGPT